MKAERQSPSLTSPILAPIKQRRSTDRSQTPPFLNQLSPIAGRTFYSPLGSYLSEKDTANVNNIPDLMILCEQLNSSVTKDNTALSTVYPVQFILKSHVYDARMHFLAGSPTLASLLLGNNYTLFLLNTCRFRFLGQPGDLVAAKTELRITQRLRLDPQQVEDLERKLRTNTTNALAMFGNNSHTNTNSLLNIVNRKQMTASNQSKFALLIASPKIPTATGSANSNQPVKNERTSPHLSTEQPEVKKEIIDEETDEEDDTLLSRLISYLTE